MTGPDQEFLRTLLSSPPQPTHLCRNCGNQVRPEERSNLNGCFLVALLCFFIIPGILYLVWASTTKKTVCPRCQASGDSLVPLASPMAKQLLGQRADAAPARAERPCPWCAEPILLAAKVCKHCGRDV